MIIKQYYVCNINIYNLFKMIKCRACLKEDGCLVLFNDEYVNYFNLLTNMNVQLCDNLPQHLCFCCLEIIKAFIEFREKCILSNYELIKSSEKKHKIEMKVIRENKSDIIRENVKNKTIKMELNVHNINEIFEHDLVDQDKHLNYDLLNDLIKTENSEEIEINSGRKTTKSSKNIAIKNKETIFSCGLCSLTFPEMSLVTIHLSSHKTNKKCNLCSQKFIDWPAILSHRLLHLKNKEKRCHICFKKFYKPIHMEYHYRKFHTEDKDYFVKCSECSHTFKTPRTLQKHMWSSHSDKKFFCDHCPKVFKSKNAIKTHMPSHNIVNHLVCDLCDYSCRFSSNLKDHKLRRHTQKKAYCKKCTRVFCDQEKLDAHKCGEKGTVCPICGKIGKTHRQLIRHMVSHDSTPRYKCERCPKAYRSKAALATHNLIHDGVRTKQCEFCSASFFSGSVLIKHRRTHTGEKPYVCRVCCRGFTGNYNLKVHMRVHGEYLIEKKKTDDVTGKD